MCSKGEWSEVEIPLSRFLLTWRGKVVEEVVELNAKRITTLGISLAGGDQLQPQVCMLGARFAAALASAAAAAGVAGPRGAAWGAAACSPAAGKAQLHRPPCEEDWTGCHSHMPCRPACLPAWHPYPNTMLQGDYQLGIDWIAARNTRIHVPEEEKRREE